VTGIKLRNPRRIASADFNPIFTAPIPALVWPQPISQNPRFRAPAIRYLAGVTSFAPAIEQLNGLSQVVVPDLWQQQAVGALREGRDVVVQAPTGAGKTLIFEVWSNQGRPRGQAIYTVPTRALANDKLAEWRARGWDVGIATGDLAENLAAPVLVATLETQKHRLIRGEGPALLVIDEYQMIADPERGLNYEIAIALAPAHTQLLLLSGSVGNPQDVVKWLRRLGRDAVAIRHDERPVPLDEVHASQISYHLPAEVRGYWPRTVAKALAEDLGPILIFAPRRQAAEEMAAELMRQLPNPNPLQLSPAQKQLVGEHLAKMLKCRIAYHHSGLSYGTRAGVIEPLAKAGQLRVVVATMGLAAGINFSLRSVALAGESYRRDAAEQPLRADEILQMFGRAGRRGLDETGYVVITANEIRLLDAHACHLARSGMVDWSALLGVMTVAAQQGVDPFSAAVRVQERLFTSKPIFLGVEESLKHPEVPCGLRTDSERARHVRKRVRELRNSRGEWEPYPAPSEVTVREVKVLRATNAGVQCGGPHPCLHIPGSCVAEALVTVALPGALGVATAEPGVDQTARAGQGTPGGQGTSAGELSIQAASLPVLRPAVSDPAAVDKVGLGTLCALSETDGVKVHGRAMTVADVLHDGRLLLAKWIRRLTNWAGRQATAAQWDEQIAPRIAQRLAQQKTPVVRFVRADHRIVAHLSIEDLPMRVPVDRHGVALWKPPEREVLPADCARCELVSECRALTAATGVALLWRRLGLVDPGGRPTLRGQMVSFFHQGDGLALAVALEDTSYPLDELVYDLANLEAGFRFCGDDNRYGGRLAIVCHEHFGLQSIPGYLENGLPPKYGAGAEHVVAAAHKDPASKYRWVSDLVGLGDIDRMIIEWRSRLRQIAHAPPLDWPRWLALQAMAKGILRQTQSPTLTELPPLEFHQTKRIEHRLILRRH
jgi:superfamily II DNA/RNA helicase